MLNNHSFVKIIHTLAVSDALTTYDDIGNGEDVITILLSFGGLVKDVLDVDGVGDELEPAAVNLTQHTIPAGSEPGGYIILEIHNGHRKVDQVKEFTLLDLEDFLTVLDTVTFLYSFLCKTHIVIRYYIPQMTAVAVLAYTPITGKDLAVTFGRGLGSCLTYKPLLGHLAHQVALPAEEVAQKFKPFAYLFPSASCAVFSFHSYQAGEQ